MSARAALLVAAVRAKGSDATDPRDAAHEACHALSWGVSKPWARDNIHAKKPGGNRSAGVSEEILARAVEQIVCKAIGYECGPVSQWAMVCWMEMLKNERISLPADDWLEKAIVAAMATERAKRMAAQVLALTDARVERASAAESAQ